MYKPSKLTTLAEIKRASLEAGNHWFDTEALRFFKSQVSDRVYPSTRERRTYFTSSEKGPDGVRRYSVRVVDWDTAGISTVGQFQRYDTSKEAHTAARRIARGHAVA